jgi:ubiquinone/menaquinone biosynthesis C-methylase UbiE
VTMLSTEVMDLETLSQCPLCSHSVATADAEMNIAECRQCGYVFDNPRPTVGAVSRFYSKPQQYDTWLRDEAPRRKLWLRRLRKFLPDAVAGNLLDVGTGIGQFLAVAAPSFTEVTGTEISESAIKIAEHHYGLKISRGEIHEIALPPQAFDNITLFHVLEHVPNPTVTLKECYRLLRQGGVLLICVPNEILSWGSKVKAFGRRLRIPAFRKFSSRYGVSRAGTSREIHLSRFTPAVLRSLVTAHGFEVISESIDPRRSGWLREKPSSSASACPARDGPKGLVAGLTGCTLRAMHFQPEAQGGIACVRN